MIHAAINTIRLLVVTFVIKANMQKEKNRQLKNQYDSRAAFTPGISLNKQHKIRYQEKAGIIKCLNFKKQKNEILFVLIFSRLIK